MVSAMSPTYLALRQLDSLNKSSTEFQTELMGVLRGDGDEARWIVDYLDKVRRHVTVSPFPSLG